MDPVSRLLEACEQGDLRSAQFYLDDGGDVDCCDEDGVTPLQVAAANGHSQLVCLLLMKAAALDRANAFGWTPLMLAARYGHTEVVNLLLQNKANVNLKNKLGAVALTAAARSGHLSTVRALLDAGADINATDLTHPELSPLMVSSQHGHDALVRILLDRGADVNKKIPTTGFTPLMFSALNGHKTTAQILVERGCDVNITNICNNTALDIAAIGGKRNITGYLEQKTKLRSKSDSNRDNLNIIEATKNGDLLKVQELLTKDISQKDALQLEDGATPLMFAAMMGRNDIVQVLVGAGANLDVRDSISGWTALMQAIFHGKKATAKYLIDAGADVNIQANNGCTAFDLASLVDDADAELIRLLATLTLKLTKQQKSPKIGSKDKNSINSSIDEDKPRGGFKTWWNRMSNHFRNLKLGRTFRLAPLPPELSVISTNDDSLIETITLPKESQTPQHRIERRIPTSGWTSSNLSVNSVNGGGEKSPVYTLGFQPNSSKLASDNIKPVIPPLLPLPSFDANTPNRSGMPPGKKLTPGNHNKDFLLVSGAHSLRTTRLLSNSIGSNLGSPGTSILIGTPSPQSSNDSGRLAGCLLNRNVPNNSTLIPTNICQRLLQSTTTGLSPVEGDKIEYKKPKLNEEKVVAATTENSSSNLKLRSENEKTNLKTEKTTSSESSKSSMSSSTLTPSPSHQEKKGSSTNSSETPVLASTLKPFPENNELAAILKKLSLEQYKPIFEEQEVDIEAFLSLTDQDLEELGIQQTQSRQRILGAISKLNATKDVSYEMHSLNTWNNYQTAQRIQTFISKLHNV